jgi:membrane protein insertase Oxa1/YidC/SpoIIIJ
MCSTLVIPHMVYLDWCLYSVRLSNVHMLSMHNVQHSVNAVSVYTTIIRQACCDLQQPLASLTVNIHVDLALCMFLCNNLQLSPPVDPNDAKAKQTQAILKYLPLMIGWFSLQVPAALGVYWMTNNIITTTATQTIKGYLKANPPQLDIPEVTASFN